MISMEMIQKQLGVGLQSSSCIQSFIAHAANQTQAARNWACNVFSWSVIGSISPTPFVSAEVPLTLTLMERKLDQRGLAHTLWSLYRAWYLGEWSVWLHLELPVKLNRLQQKLSDCGPWTTAGLRTTQVLWRNMVAEQLTISVTWAHTLLRQFQAGLDYQTG